MLFCTDSRVVAIMRRNKETGDEKLFNNNENSHIAMFTSSLLSTRGDTGVP